ncbi:MAG: hypothetical protein A3J93_05430 [Candidatus Magasanikbacteria bacterium RIFOXYC2_FULL_42_28]|uniref:ABC transporter domain-containing protein n=1 Tax=Candidatus Magasanikbacteria bacterium RIFOXYC2_FULL_42_28 TaxID=1798704 RepID=A0A1F6NVJ7_9BACT|nr:MAG: hypothetical protein A3J93_05430 [Candidatus Magasanikbacteria bacterium RIFOXYC2_FULL_42_28]
MPILELQNLTKSFSGIKAVHDLSFKFSGGKITGLIGPNGSGKTTLINVLTGLLPIDSGLIIINGEKLSKILPHETPTLGLTRTFQNVRLFNQITVLDNLLLVLTDKGPIKTLRPHLGIIAQNKADEILHQIQLYEKRHNLAGDLSYGQRKLLEIGRALATDTHIYLFDEPFAGLFPEMAKIVEAILKNLRANGKTIILVEHNMTLIRELCDEVVVLNEGKLLAAGTPGQVLSKKEVLDAYLGE